jgi:prefoldin subunit 5
LYNEAIKQYLNQLQELRQYSVQIETALHEYEENIMKIEEEISNNTLCN